MTKEQNKAGRLWTIFITMAKIGCFTFGGGWSIIAQMEDEFVERRSWMTKEQIVDFMSGYYDHQYVGTQRLYHGRRARSAGGGLWAVLSSSCVYRHCDLFLQYLKE